MTRAKITGVSYTPPRTIGIQYTVSPLVFQLEMPIEKCDQISDIHAAIETDYNAKIQNPNNNFLRTLSQNIVGTEFDFELDDKSNKKLEQDLRELKRIKFMKKVLEDRASSIPDLDPDDVIVVCGCKNYMPD